MLKFLGVETKQEKKRKEKVIKNFFTLVLIYPFVLLILFILIAFESSIY